MGDVVTAHETFDRTRWLLAPLLAGDGSTRIEVQGRAGAGVAPAGEGRHTLTVRTGPVRPRVDADVVCHRLRRFVAVPGRGGDLLAAPFSAWVLESGRPGAPRPIDQLSTSCGIALDRVPLRLRAGSFLAVVGDRVVRGGQGPLAEGHRIQQRAAASGVPAVPEVFGLDEADGWWCAAEARVEGVAALRPTAARLEAVARFCAALPSAEAVDLGSVTAGLDELAAFREPLTVIAAAVEAAAPAARTVHGDCWLGNCLWQGETLAAVVDWDRAAAAGVDGTDLVHLRAMHDRMVRRRSLGASLRARAWRGWVREERMAGAWSALGLPSAEDAVDVIGVAWWLRAVVTNAAQRPTETWVVENVERAVPDALAMLGLT